MRGFFAWMLRGGGPPRDPAELDELVLKQLRKIGCDLTRPRHVRHYLSFEGEDETRRAEAALEEAGFTATVTAPTDEAPAWIVMAEAYRVVSARSVVESRTWFENLAAESHGSYDGWEPATKP
jgi:hypothetical protein